MGVVFEQLEQARPAAWQTLRHANHVAIIADVEERRHNEKEREIEIEQTNEMNLKQPGHGDGFRVGRRVWYDDTVLGAGLSRGESAGRKKGNGSTGCVLSPC